MATFTVLGELFHQIFLRYKGTWAWRNFLSGGNFRLYGSSTIWNGTAFNCMSFNGQPDIVQAQWDCHRFMQQWIHNA